MTIFSRRFWMDTTERTIGTFAAAVTGATWLGLNDWKTWAAVGTTTVFTFLKCLAASQKGDPQTASLIEPD